jgi:hypothetical protein
LVAPGKTKMARLRWVFLRIEISRYFLPLPGVPGRTGHPLGHPGIKIHDTRIIRLLEVLLHGGNTVGGWTAKQIHEAVITTFQLSPNTYGLNQLRYDLASSKVAHFSSVMAGAMPTASTSTLRSCSCSYQAPLWTACQQPLPSQARSRTPTKQQTRGRLSQGRQGHPEHR